MSATEPDTTAPDLVSDPRRQDRRMLRWIVGGVVVVAGGLYAAGVAFASDRLPQDTTVAGVDVGGLRPAKAEQRLAQALDPRADDPLQLEIGDRQFTVDPRDVGFEVDVEASIDQVPVGRTWRIDEMWEIFVGGVDREAVVEVDEVALDKALKSIAEKVDVPAVEGDIRFTDRPKAVPVYPRVGERLDRTAAAVLVAAAYPSDGEPLRLDLVEDVPEVTTEAVDEALEEIAEPALSAPVGYRIGGEPVVLRPRAFAPALAMEPSGGELELVVNRKRLLRVFDPAMRTVAEQPADATVAIVDSRPQVIPAKKGVTVDYDRVVESFPGLVTAPRGERVLSLRTQVEEPDFTTEEAEALGIVEMVSEFPTYYPHADYRNTNIGRAADLIDGTVLKPGETFSLNETVGERTRENGFTEGFIIADGVFREELGGGVSQVATTTFNAAFFAGLEDVEHKPHSFYIDRYPVGREATVVWPVVDLKFTNDTDYGVLIETVHTPSTPSSSGALTVRMWSTKVWDIESVTGSRYAFTEPETRRLSGDTCVPNEGYSGFSINVTRVFRRAGESEVVRREVMRTTYTPSDTVICEEEEEQKDETGQQ